MATLGDFPSAAVLRADNLDRAKTFYTDILGLHPSGVPAPTGEVMLEGKDGTMVELYERPGLPAPENTVLGFGVPADQFDTTISELRGRGVDFENYDMPEIGLKTINGVAEYHGAKAAWFKDTEGNILNIASM